MVEWDMALTKSGDYVVMRMPAPLSKALLERGFARAKVSVLDDGILVVPYVAERTHQVRVGAVLELPEWGR